MRAAVTRGRAITVDDVPNPEPGPGQVLVETLACGICGSDLHQLQSPETFVEAAAATGSPLLFDPARDLVMGHEFCARVVQLGPGAGGVQPGDIVVSMPVLATPSGVAAIGYSNDYPGGFGERMVLTSALCLRVPDGVDPRHAALTEPLAVGIHAVSLSGVQPGRSAVVIGCGPIGLAVIAALKAAGVEKIVASDFSPGRRTLAARLGAARVVDPRAESLSEAARPFGEPAVVFEAVGAPGVLDEAMGIAARRSALVVVGACVQRDTIWPLLGVVKELTLQFALGYSPEEFARSLALITGGGIDCEPLITGEVGLDGVMDSFTALGAPDRHVKILVEPSRTA